jgi:hypothetical protein
MLTEVDTRMKALRTFASATVLAVGLAIFPATATAGTKTYTYSVWGTEVYATSTTGRFVGTTTGDATGTWYAEVLHDPLNPHGKITGGSFGMLLNKAEPAYTVSGHFWSGFVEQRDPGENCTNQRYAVNGSLDNVTVTRTGTFQVTLTHYRRAFFGKCRLYAATVSGMVTLPDPVKTQDSLNRRVSVIP